MLSLNVNAYKCSLFYIISEIIVQHVSQSLHVHVLRDPECMFSPLRVVWGFFLWVTYK